MENELIIDGQVIDLSETQENAEETIIQTESQPENESQDDNGKEVATEPEKTEETPEDYALRTTWRRMLFIACVVASCTKAKVKSVTSPEVVVYQWRMVGHHRL